MEVILTLFGFKLLYPDYFHMARGCCLDIVSNSGQRYTEFSFCLHVGNHETENMNQMYGFHGEVKSKYPLN